MRNKLLIGCYLLTEEISTMQGRVVSRKRPFVPSVAALLLYSTDPNRLLIADLRRRLDLLRVPGFFVVVHVRGCK